MDHSLGIRPVSLLLALLAPLAFPALSRAAAGEGVPLTSPGFQPSRMDVAGRLVEDWGSLTVDVVGEGLPPPGPVTVGALLLEGIVPAARAAREIGGLRLVLTAYRAPAWPAGLDVLEARIEETAGKEVSARLALTLPEGARVGRRTASLAGRTVLALPEPPGIPGNLREWGWLDEAASLPGWARPEGECSPAFRSIRAGLGGVPILYRFAVGAKGSANVVLGFCESHWAQAGQRPVTCNVEGAPPQDMDPVARWGQHKPGAILLAGTDKDGDGYLDVSVLPKPGAPDQNPILSAIWLFPAGAPPSLDQVIRGALDGQAVRFVDCGGEKDQSVLPPGRIEFPLKLPPKGGRTWTFIVASPGSSAPVAERTGWTPAALRKAAVDVWRGWKD